MRLHVCTGLVCPGIQKCIVVQGKLAGIKEISMKKKTQIDSEYDQYLVLLLLMINLTYFALQRKWEYLQKKPTTNLHQFLLTKSHRKE